MYYAYVSKSCVKECLKALVFMPMTKLAFTEIYSRTSLRATLLLLHVHVHVKLKLSCSVHTMDYSDNLSVLLIVHI